MKSIVVLIIAILCFGCGSKKECDYKLPYQYFLVRDSVTKKYAIRWDHLNQFSYYLYTRGFSFPSKRYSNMGSASEAETFSDSCEAKGFAKTAIDYIESKNADRFKQ